jgi:hypothetical protein
MSTALNTEQTNVPPGSLQPDGSARAANRKEAQRLLNEAIIAVAALSDHLRETHDDWRMHKANQAIHKLWQIE